MAMDINEFFEIIKGDDIQTTKFGNYTITGDLSLIGTFDNANIFQQLYYNHSNNQYFLMKRYASEKVHIDFFKSFSSVPKGLLFGTSGYMKTCVAVNNGNPSKELYYDFDNERYIISSQNDDKVYNISFGGLKGR